MSTECSRSRCHRADSLSKVAGRPYCQSHYRTATLDEFGRCSFLDPMTGKRCRSRRFTRCGPSYSDRPGFCREHEPEHLRTTDQELLRATTEEFVSYLAPDSESGCWHWRGPGREGGKRGFMWAAGLRWTPYRFAYALLVGGHGNRLELNHLCGNGNPADGRGTCCNPLHLRPETPVANRRFIPAADVVNAHVQANLNSFAGQWALARGLPVGFDLQKYLDVKINQIHLDEIEPTDQLSAQ